MWLNTKRLTFGAHKNTILVEVMYVVKALITCCLRWDSCCFMSSHILWDSTASFRSFKCRGIRRLDWQISHNILSIWSGHKLKLPKKSAHNTNVYGTLPLTLSYFKYVPCRPNGHSLKCNSILLTPPPPGDLCTLQGL